MYLTDYHTHSLCSPDGSAPLVELAQAALDAGMDEMCLTDHCDFLDFNGNLDLTFTWAPIEEQLVRGKLAFEGRLPIKMGLELGEPWEYPHLANKLYRHKPVDFVLGSVHNLPLSEGGRDFYFDHFETEEQCYALLDSYFNAMEILAGMDCYDVLAHVIYPLRYFERDGNHVTLDRYADQLRRIFLTAIHKGKGIELNTCRGRTIEDWRWVLELYRDCGGVLITLGSDAHTPEDVGKGIREGADLLRELGFPYIATYDRHNVNLKHL